MQKFKKFILMMSIATGVVLLSSGCQAATKSLGGSMTLELDPGEKLIEITWKDDSLWYLTRPMREDEEPETYKFKQSSEFGIFEGTVTVVESKEK